MQFHSNRAFSTMLATLVLGLTYTAAAADQASKASILGKWNLDADAMMKMMEKQVDEGKLPGEQLALIKGVIGSMKMTVEFKADGTMSVSVNTLGQSQDKKGTWSLVSAKENTLTVNTKVDDKSDEVMITVNGKDAITLHPPKGSPGAAGFEGMPLKREKPSP